MQNETRNTRASRPAAVWTLILLMSFLGLNAFVAGVAFILAPDGHLIQMPMSNLERAPFTNFLVPGILLSLFIGIYPMVIAFGLWKLPSWMWPNALNPFKEMHWSWAGSMAAGISTIVWIIVQVQWIQFGALHAIVLVWGASILAMTLLPSVRRYCTRHG